MRLSFFRPNQVRDGVRMQPRKSPPSSETANGEPHGDERQWPRVMHDTRSTDVRQPRSRAHARYAALMSTFFAVAVAFFAIAIVKRSMPSLYSAFTVLVSMASGKRIERNTWPVRISDM